MVALINRSEASHGAAKGKGGPGTAGAAGVVVTSVRHPHLFLHTGSLNPDRYLSRKTPSPYLETFTQFEKDEVLTIFKEFIQQILTEHLLYMEN